MSLDSESLGIPETEYSSIIEMSSSEFARICKELNQISETGTLSISSLRSHRLEPAPPKLIDAW